MNDRIPSRGEVDRTIAGLKTHQSPIVRHRAHLLARELERLRQDNEYLRTQHTRIWRWINAKPIWLRIRDWIDQRTTRRVTP